MGLWVSATAAGQISSRPGRAWAVPGVGGPGMAARDPVRLGRHAGCARASRRRGPLDVHDRAGQRAGDPGHRLDLGDHETAEIVDVLRLGTDDHVVGAGHVLRLGDAGYLGDMNRDLRGFPDLGLNEDVRLYHAVLPEARLGPEIATLP